MTPLSDRKTFIPVLCRLGLHRWRIEKRRGNQWSWTVYRCEHCGDEKARA